ncbi:MAG TPA: RCC1 repeat-containing protein, partial [bacterium]|nr:RCC1 repeat-containing protein [bacterium]
CALTTSGGVKCWGNNDYGILGDGTTTDSNIPVDVVGLTNGVVSVSSGVMHACALTTSGGVKCWGDNAHGKLGDGMITSSTIPVDVVGLTSGVALISSGAYHTCALTTSGGVKCWGNNDYGQLGDGTNTDRHAPVDVVGLTSGVASVSSGFDHTCAVTTSGGVKCWGTNYYGQIGDGTTTNSYMPVDVVGLASGVISVSSWSSHTCAVTTSGGVKCWGSNENGQLGDGTTTYSYTPVDVVGLTSGIASVSSGNLHTCAVTTSGCVKCWGSNVGGKLGINPGWVPVNVIGF